MALIAMSVGDTIRYVSDLDPCKRKEQRPVNPEDENSPMEEITVIDPGATVFLLAGLDNFIDANILDNASNLIGRDGSDEVKIQTMANATYLEIVKFGLRGWERFLDAGGNEVRFKSKKINKSGREYTIAAEESINLLQPDLIRELANKIRSYTTVSPAQAKN